jgi:hypothetical protein
MKNIGTLLTDDSLTVVVNGNSRTIHKSHLNFSQALDAYKDSDWDRLVSVLDAASAVKAFGEGSLEVVDGSIRWNGQVVHNTICNRIFDFMQKDYPYKPLLNFLNKLMENPSKHCVDQLYNYVEKYKLPIEDNGNFLAWKAVDADLKDLYTHTIDNSVGKTVSKRRNECVDDQNIACAASLHCGNYQYVREYGSGEDCRFVMVSVHPKDVVACPIDSEWQKLRVCEYEVKAEVSRAEVTKFSSEYAPKIKSYPNKTGCGCHCDDGDGNLFGDNCPNCGEYNSYDENECSSCGEALEV